MVYHPKKSKQDILPQIANFMDVNMLQFEDKVYVYTTIYSAKTPFNNSGFTFCSAAVLDYLTETNAPNVDIISY